MDFKDIDGILNVTIDNQSIPLQMKELIKETTFFTIQKNLNTPLYSYIDIDLLLEHSNEEDDSIESDTADIIELIDETQNQQKKPVEKGVVILTIRDTENLNIIYDKQEINFYDGIIQTKMTNTLRIGDYMLDIYYPGNKYYQAAALTVLFSVEKREIKCTFDNEYIDGYPDTNINFGATFKDALTDIPVSNCTINYTFNNIDYVTQTNQDGYVIFNIDMPSVNPYRCFKKQNEEEIDVGNYVINEDNEYYINADGNLELRNNSNSDIDGLESTFITDDTTTEDLNFDVDIVDTIIDDEEEDFEEPSINTDATYTVIITVDDNVYYSVNDIIAYVHSRIVDTEINFSAIADNDGNIHVEGDVISKDENITTNITYGKIIPNISNIPINTTYEVDEFGHFTFDTSVPSPTMSQKEPTTFSNYDTQIPTSITLTSNTENTISRSWAEKHYVDFTAVVQSGYTPINHSMVTFFIFKGNKEIYRYITELNSNGEAFFSMNVSTLGTFTIKATYHGMFGYLSSISEELKYTIIEES